MFRFNAKNKLLLFGTLGFALIIFVFIWVEVNESRRDLMQSVKAEANTLIETLNRGSETTILANSEMEELLIGKLNAIAEIVVDKEFHKTVQQHILTELAHEYNLTLVSLIDSSGKVLTSSDKSTIGGYLSGNFLKQITPVLSGEYAWLSLGNQKYPGSEDVMFLLAHERRDSPGAILIGMDGKKLLEFRKRIGIGRLIQDIGDNPDIAYIVIQDEDGILTASRGVRSMAAIADDPFLKSAFDSNKNNSRITEYQGLSVFEVVQTISFENGLKVLSRVGLSLENVQSIQQRSMTRVIIFGIGIVVMSAFLLGFILTKERYAVLKEEHRKIQSYTDLVLDNMADAVIAMNYDRTITVFNKAAEKMLKVKRSNAIGVKYDIACPGDPVGLGKTLASEQGIPFTEVEYQYKTSVVIYLGVSTSIIYKSNGDIETIVGIARDLTEQKKIEEQLHRKEKLSAMGELASGIAHEIRNPINAINVIAQRFLHEFEPANDSEEFRKLSQTVRSEVQRVNLIIKQFLEFARPPKLLLERTSVAEVINETIALLESQAKMLGITISKMIDDGLEADMDKGRMKQALMNLMQNAIEAMDQVGEIKCVACKKNKAIQISISDNGRGIPAEIRSKIFNLYFTTKPSGTGFGLSLVHQIVSEHGGEISVASEEKGGTTFLITLPEKRY